MSAPQPPPEHRPPRPYMSRTELARVLHVSPRTIDEMVRAGRIPHVHIGRILRFNLPEVVAALTSNPIPTPPEP